MEMGMEMNEMRWEGVCVERKSERGMGGEYRWAGG